MFNHQQSIKSTTVARRRRWLPRSFCGFVLAVLVCGQTLLTAQAGAGAADKSPSLEETRLTMGKWIETQQIIAKERKDWQQGKEILLGRLELVKKEVSTLADKIKLASASVAEAGKRRGELQAEQDQLKAAGARLTEIICGLESEVRKMSKSIPEPIRARLQPLYLRVPDDPAKTRASTAERFQNVLGILNELNKANNEISVSYEVRTLADGKPAEVRVMYLGLAQAYYVSANGEAGIGRPTLEGWVWTPSRAVSADVLMALEILQGKQSPAFVPLPVKIQ
jgi:hypothetical protein